MPSNQKQPWDTNIFLFPLEMSPMYAKDLTKLKPRNQQIKRNIFNYCNERECKKEYMCVLSHFNHVRLCDPMDCSPPGSSLLGVLQERILEWVAMSSSRGSSQPRDQTCVLCLLELAGFFTTNAIWEAYMATFPGLLMVKKPPADEGVVKRLRFNSGSGRSPWHGNPLHYSCLENPMNRSQRFGHNWATKAQHSITSYTWN